MDTIAFLARARLDAGVLETWIGAGWVVPRDDAETHRFAEIDVARAQLISDLKDDIGVNDEGVAIILDLIDQIHGLRGSLRDLSAALSAQPEAVRRAVAADLAPCRRVGPASRAVPTTSNPDGDASAGAAEGKSCVGHRPERVNSRCPAILPCRTGANVGAHRIPCLPSSLTVLACGPFSPISSLKVTRVPTCSLGNAPLSALFLWK